MKHLFFNLIEEEFKSAIQKGPTYICDICWHLLLKHLLFNLIEEEFKSAIQEGPTYICDICWKFEYKKNVIKLKHLKYGKEL